MRAMIASCFVVLFACSGGTEPDAGPLHLQLFKVGGDEQEGRVAELLPDPLEVTVTRRQAIGDLRLSLAGTGPAPRTQITGTPLRGQRVDFVVPDPDCGRPLAPSAVTDPQGRAVVQWELGEVAKRCALEVRALDERTGETLATETFNATAVPGPVASVTWRLDESELEHVRVTIGGASRDLSYLVSSARDQFGNETPYAVTLSYASTDPPPVVTISGSSVVSGLEEGTTSLTVSVGAVTRQTGVRVHAAHDLTTSRWRADLTCFRDVDTTHVVIVSDTVRYLNEFDSYYKMWGTATFTSNVSGTTTRTEISMPGSLTGVAAQQHGRVFFLGRGGLLVSTSPRTYAHSESTPHPCIDVMPFSHSAWEQIGVTTLTAIP